MIFGGMAAAVLQELGTPAAQRLGDALESLIGLAPELQRNLFLSLVAVFLVALGHRVLLRIVDGRDPDPKARYQWSKISGYLAFFLTMLLLGIIWFDAVGNLATFLGLLSAGLAIALRDIVANMAGWAFIILRHPFVVGDRVQMGEHRGDVVDIRLFQFTLVEIGNWVDADQSTGRVIHIPNSRVFTTPQANYTSQFAYVWHEIPVALTFESDWRKAKSILEEVVGEHTRELVRNAEEDIRLASRKYLILYGTLTPKIYTSVKENGVLLTLRFLCPVRQRRGVAERIWEGILDRFAAETDISFAYPTHRVFANFLEGKEGARAEIPLPGAGPEDDGP